MSDGVTESTASSTFLVEASEPAGSSAADAVGVRHRDDEPRQVDPVTDTVAGEENKYRNEPGIRAPAITDPTAFPDRCLCVVSRDARHRLLRSDSGHGESLGGDGRRVAA